MLVLAFTGISIMLLGGVMTWTSNNASQNQRNNQYFTSVAAAESATEKVIAMVNRDFQTDGESLVYANLANYRAAVPTSSENAYWSDWRFGDAQGNDGASYVQRLTSWGWVDLNSQYTGLYGMASTYRVVSNARQLGRPGIVGALRQDFQVANIPIFQFAIFYGIEMEISCGQAFNVTGRVHSNNNLWVLPDSALTFQTHVTAVGNITFSRAPGDSRGFPVGSVTYLGEKDAKVAALTLPIGTNNTPDAVHAILEVPPITEAANSTMGKQRYYNKADMIVVVSNSAVVVTSGRFNTFGTTVPSAEAALFVKTNGSFYDARQGKTVKLIDIDVEKLRAWSQTNSSLRADLGRDVRSVYVADRRTLGSSQFGAVRMTNGATLPSMGLTVATEKPIYVKGHFNAPSAYRGTTNTTATLPASLVGDAITILSEAWTDSNSTSDVSSRNAADTTVNAAFLAGIVETKTYNVYSGGAENFPRFLETWGSSRTFTYNGSMVILFPSRFATNPWGMSGVYSPPRRNWAFDLNFMEATKLPPGTPEVRTLIRGQWALMAPSSTE